MALLALVLAACSSPAKVDVDPIISVPDYADCSGEHTSDPCIVRPG